MVAISTTTAHGPTIDSSVRQGSLVNSIHKATEYLSALQQPGGYWVGELESDARLTASYIPFMHFMSRPLDENRKAKAVSYILTKQNRDGSWPSYFGGPGELDVTVQTYFTLKLAGISASEPVLQRAREFILGSGGVFKTNTLTKTWLALFGQYDWQLTPSVPIELMLLPDSSPFGIYGFSGCGRQTAVALMVISTVKPVTTVPEIAQVPELYVEDERSTFKPGKTLSWPSFRCRFEKKLVGMASFFPLQPTRGVALRKAERWILDRQEADGTWGGAILPSVFSLIALTSLGYGVHHPVVERGLRGVEGLIAEDDRTLRIQPATSPVWDTAWSIIALRNAGIGANDPALVQAGNWLLDQQILRKGDWSIRIANPSPGGWAFEFGNDIYPDVDDTAVVCRALRSIDLGSGNHRNLQAVERGTHWAATMQADDGGWAAFDRNPQMKLMENLHFGDFAGPIDPACADVTAHMLELLGEVAGYGRSVDKAICFLRRRQKPDGSWYGRWGVNYICGTGLTLAGLRAVKEDPRQEYLRRAVKWLESHQNQDGGWGETCGTYDLPGERGIGTSTASQTAWALIGLIAASRETNSSVVHGVRYLIDSQRMDGSWSEDLYTGTGIPGCVYFRYSLYPAYFPLLALSQFRDSLSDGPA